MIIRPVLTADAAQIAAWAGLEQQILSSEGLDFQLTLFMPSLVRAPKLSYIKRGLMDPSRQGKDPKDVTVQVHAEALTCSAHLRSDLLKRRCLIPANSLQLVNEVGENGGLRYLLSPISTLPFWLAGILEVDRTNSRFSRFALIDIKPEGFLRLRFDRLPILIDDKEKMSWLAAADRDAALRLLRPMSNKELVHWVVEAGTISTTTQD